MFKNRFFKKLEGNSYKRAKTRPHFDLGKPEFTIRDSSMPLPTTVKTQTPLPNPIRLLAHFSSSLSRLHHRIYFQLPHYLSCSLWIEAETIPKSRRFSKKNPSFCFLIRSFCRSQL